MSNQTQLTRTNQQQLNSPFSAQKDLPAAANTGAVAIEQERAIAEAQGQLVLAKRFPRDLNSAHSELMSACSIPSLAAIAFYNVPRAGGTVSGPSIRLAEEVARCYGNFEYGHRELSRDHEKSEVEVYAWDKEKNNFSRRQITVKHTIDKKVGGVMTAVKLTSQKDIDDNIAKVASKQMRGRILALLPKWMVEDAIQTCRSTLAGNNREPIEVRVRKMVSAFGQFGVTVEMLQKHLGHELKNVTSDELVDLMGVYNSIKEGHVRASEFFQDEAVEPKKDVIESGGKARQASTGFKPAEKQDKKPAAKQQKAAEPEPEPQPESEDDQLDGPAPGPDLDDGFDPDQY